MRAPALGLCVVLVVSSGCFRANYYDLRPHEAVHAVQTEQPVRASGWQQFYLYGWAPGTRTIDAADRCGGAENLDSIRTRQKFVQGLIAAVATILIVNIYSPWDGAVWCRERPPKAARRR